MLKRLASTEYSLFFIEYGIKPVRVRGSRSASGVGVATVLPVFSTYEFSKRVLSATPHPARRTAHTHRSHHSLDTQAEASASSTPFSQLSLQNGPDPRLVHFLDGPTVAVAPATHEPTASALRVNASPAAAEGTRRGPAGHAAWERQRGAAVVAARGGVARWRAGVGVPRTGSA
jgi:hypothetical protein